MVYVALLRGINVAGKNRLAMKDLCGWFEREGCVAVRHYIQSGNVVFETSATTAKTIGAKIENAIKKHAKLDVPIVVRTRAELASVVAKNPFLERTSDGKILHVGFLAQTPKKDAIAGLDPNRSPPDELAVLGREVYLHCPNGIGKSKLTTQWFDSKLATTSTFRNWNTVLKLKAMTEE